MPESLSHADTYLATERTFLVCHTSIVHLQPGDRRRRSPLLIVLLDCHSPTFTADASKASTASRVGSAEPELTRVHGVPSWRALAASRTQYDSPMLPCVFSADLCLFC